MIYLKLRPSHVLKEQTNEATSMDVSSIPSDTFERRQWWTGVQLLV